MADGGGRRSLLTPTLGTPAWSMFTLGLDHAATNMCGIILWPVLPSRPPAVHTSARSTLVSSRQSARSAHTGPAQDSPLMRPPSTPAHRPHLRHVHTRELQAVCPQRPHQQAVVARRHKRRQRRARQPGCARDAPRRAPGSDQRAASTDVPHHH
eukprot:360521-Chlamydomonas_euryale.AAC.4